MTSTRSRTTSKTRRGIIGAAVAVAALAGGGAAIAATHTASTPQAESRAVIDDAAGRLGVTPSKLSNALITSMETRIDAAVKAGTMTAAQAADAKKQLESGNVPLVGGLGGPGGHRGGPGGRHGGPGGMGAAAAKYLGVTEQQLGTQLASGKSLADVAKAQGKDVAGLETALVAAERAHLDADVKAGRLSAEQEKTMLAGLAAHVHQEVTEVHTGGPMGPPPAGAPGVTPPASGPASATTGSAGA
jgi:hypothetical protein